MKTNQPFGIQMKNKIIILYTFVLVPLLLLTEAQAAIYKCVKTNNDVFYNDKPCPASDEESQLNAVKDPEGGYIPPELSNKSEKVGSKDVTVGATSERSISKTDKELSDGSSTGGTSNNSSSNSQSSSDKKVANNSSQNQSKSNSKKSKTENLKYPVKNVVHREGDYKKQE